MEQPQQEIPEGIWTDQDEKDFQERIAWFVKKRRRIAWTYGCENIFVNESGVFGQRADGTMVRIR